MDKIKCVETENGTIIPIHNISIISGPKYSHYIWTNSNTSESSRGYKLTDNQYEALLEELEMI